MFKKITILCLAMFLASSLCACGNNVEYKFSPNRSLEETANNNYKSIMLETEKFQK